VNEREKKAVSPDKERKRNEKEKNKLCHRMRNGTMYPLVDKWLVSNQARW